MRVARIELRNFRTYERAGAALGDGLTVVVGANGVGKTNLVEGLYFGCTGRSCRTRNDREVVRFGTGTVRVVVDTHTRDGSDHQLTVGFTPGEPKHMTVDGVRVERLLDAEPRPLISVFMPDRLELIKGVPAIRRAHVDHLVAALWPARDSSRRAYAAALTQRNALLSRVRSGLAPRTALDAWDLSLARHGLTVMRNRQSAVELIASPFTEACERLGLDGEPKVVYRPRSRALDEDGLIDELRAHLENDLQRGFTGHGPHRDELSLLRAGHELRVYGSQGQQRLGLLSLLLAERSVIGLERGIAPLMLLDDVVSELDGAHRRALLDTLRASEGQALITTTDPDQIPGAEEPDVMRLLVTPGGVLEDGRL